MVGYVSLIKAIWHLNSQSIILTELEGKGLSLGESDGKNAILGMVQG
jgi:hypothetical protein